MIHIQYVLVVVVKDIVAVIRNLVMDVRQALQVVVFVVLGQVVRPDQTPTVNH